MRKWFILIIIFLLIVVGYNYVYQDHRNIKKESATFIVSATVIGIEFAQSPIESQNKYSNKTIEVSGFITELNKKNLTLDNKVFCQFENTINQSFKMASKLKVKGRCIGYDDLLEQVKLDQCNIFK